MKWIYIALLISFGLQIIKADDEVPTEPESANTDPSTVSDENEPTVDSPKNNEEMPEMLNDLEARLPSDYQSIRAKVIDSKFDCKEHEPGYYADIENDCQIFHRCLEDQDRVYSFICPEQTIFSQKALVCVWHETRDLDCSESESYYEESNRAFSGNMTAMSAMSDNLNNSTEILEMEVEDAEKEEIRDDVMSESIKFVEIIPNHELEVTEEESESEMVEKNSIEEKKEDVSVEEETEKSDEFEAELLPSSLNGPDASIASSSATAESESHPQKISISILDPIVELPVQAEEAQPEITETSRNIRKRSGNHRNRFLFKADAH